MHNIETAGEVVGLNLKEPIDCSQMEVRFIECSPEQGEYSFSKMFVKRTSVLHAFVINDEGDREELTITFELKSQRMPKLKQK